MTGISEEEAGSRRPCMIRCRVELPPSLHSEMDVPTYNQRNDREADHDSDARISSMQLLCSQGSSRVPGEGCVLMDDGQGVAPPATIRRLTCTH